MVWALARLVAGLASQLSLVTDAVLRSAPATVAVAVIVTVV